jgi:hypothetical protein
MSENDRLGPPPVEPLSDVAWSRIERGLWSRLDTTQSVEHRPARPRRWMWLAAPAFAAAAAAAVLTVGDRSSDLAPSDSPARLVSGAAPTTLSYGNVHIRLDADSAVVMDRLKGAVLERGAAWFAVAPRGDRAPFVVTAGDAVVRVVGTKFRVARSGDDATVQVEHGTVEVLFRGATTRVGSGEQWTSRQPSEVSGVQVAEREAAPALEPVRGAPVAPPAAAPPAVTAVTVPEPMPSADPKSPARSNRPVSGIRTTPMPAPAPTTAPQNDDPRTEKPAAEEAASEHPPVEKPGQTDADAAKYHQLEQLEVRNSRAAIDGYLELARRSPRWAEPAMFAAARLAADRAEPRARRLIEIYLTRFPSGANVDDARKLLDHMQGANR